MLDANNGYNLNLAKRVLEETADCAIFWMAIISVIATSARALASAVSMRTVARAASSFCLLTVARRTSSPFATG